MVDTLERKEGVLTLPEPAYPTREVSSTRPTRGRFRLGTVVRPLLLAALLGGGAGWYIDTHPQMIDQGKKAAEAWMLEHGLLKDPTIFDSNNQFGEISPLNSVALPLEVIKEKTRIEPGKAIHIGSFFQTPGPAEIKYVKGLPYFGPTSGIANPADAPEYNKYLKEGVKNTIAFTNLPLGTVVLAPFAGKASRMESQWADKSFSLTMVFVDNGGNWYHLLFKARDAEAIAPVPKLDPKTRSKKLDNWLDVELGQPLFTIRSGELVPGNQGFNYYSQLSLEANNLPNGIGKGAVPINIQFITEGDKIVVPANN